MRRPPLGERRPDDPELPERLAGLRPVDAGCEDLWPAAVGLPVVHDQVRVDEVARNAELRPAAFEPLCGAGERAVRDRDGVARERVVDYLVIHQHVLGVRLRLAVTHDAEHGLLVGDRRVGDRLERRVVDRGDPVLADAAVQRLVHEELGLVGDVPGRIRRRRGRAVGAGRVRVGVRFGGPIGFRSCGLIGVRSVGSAGPFRSP